MSREHRRCTVCDDWAWFPGHACPPRWLVAIKADCTQLPDEDEYIAYYARSTDEAAEKAAEEEDCNSAEYGILRAGESGDYIAYVKASVEAVPQRFSIVGESVPTYHAREMA